MTIRSTNKCSLDACGGRWKAGRKCLRKVTFRKQGGQTLHVIHDLRSSKTAAEQRLEGDEAPGEGESEPPSHRHLSRFRDFPRISSLSRFPFATRIR